MSAASLWLIVAVLAQGVLVFIIAALLYQARIPLIVRGKVRIGDIALDREAWPEASRKVANSFSNQFELPLLFYVAALLALTFGATLVDVVIAWLFVISRYVHAFIHVTNNHVVRRFFAFATGTIILAVWWLVLTVRLIVVAIAGGGA
jgi:hypothetical protein